MHEPLAITPSPANPPPVVFGPPRPAISVRGLGKAFRIGLPPGARTKKRGLRGALAAPLAGFKRLANLDVAADATADPAPPAELILPGHPNYIGPVRPLPDPSAWRCLGDIDLMAATARRPAVEHDLVWALRDVTFTVGAGQVVGVVGRNGAGKSTLLKVLSRITDPTVGRAEIRGRVCSLLEVGTGFHKELTGRENVYMNGTVLGMTRREIDAAFDEIVDFSGVEEFLDTPVKRYSSGMKVRLAFSVAAHLRPEILIVDEVLAVGDAEFQEKCLGKMKDVAAGGRTVLFVSHNLKAVKQLCTRAVVLSGGRVLWTGPVEDPFPLPEPEPVVEERAGEEPEPVRVPPYEIPKAERLVYEEPVFGGGEAAVAPVGPAVARVTRLALLDERGRPAESHRSDAPVTFRVEYSVARPVEDLVALVRLTDAAGAFVLDLSNRDVPAAAPVPPLTPPGDYVGEVTLPADRLNVGELRARALLVQKDVANLDAGPLVRLGVEAAGGFLFAASSRGRRGPVTLPLPWDHGPAGTDFRAADRPAGPRLRRAA